MPSAHDRFVVTVTQLNEYVKSLMGADPLLRGLSLKGEISNFKRHSSGHLYFSLKDESSVIRCVMFRQNAFGLNFTPRDGRQVVLTGYVSVYTRDGQYQFYCEKMQADGVGALYQQFERNKARFAAEGLFDAEHKRPLPALCRRIGVATSPTGAVIRDIIRVSHRRNPSVDILLAPCHVQGEGAAGEIAAAIRVLNRQDVDVIIVGRGGGSLEDLWAFNEEEVVRAVYASRVPVISAVGHETDFALSDFAADVRASTPSNAAEFAVLDLSDVMQNLDSLTSLLDAAALRAVDRRGRELELLCRRVSVQAAVRRLDQNAEIIKTLERQMDASALRRIDSENERLTHLAARLDTLNPENVLRRGYALIRKNEKTISSVLQMKPGDEMRVQLRDGVIFSQVTGIEEKHEKADL